MSKVIDTYTYAAAAKSLQSCLTLCDPIQQPTRLLCPWDSPGKNTGVGCHFLLHFQPDSPLTDFSFNLIVLPGSSADEKPTLYTGDPGSIAGSPWVRKIPWRRDRLPTPVYFGFSDGSVGKEFTCDAGDLVLIPGLRKFPEGGCGNPLQYSCLENPRGQRSLAGYGPWGLKASDTAE